MQISYDLYPKIRDNGARVTYEKRGSKGIPKLMSLLFSTVTSQALLNESNADKLQPLIRTNIKEVKESVMNISIFLKAPG